MAIAQVHPGLIEKYRNHLPVTSETPVITLNEGNTPLIQCRNITKDLAVPVEIYLKFEGLNPTGSFKDRGMTMAVSKAVEEGAKAVVCASTGNTSAAAAAYAARAGISCFVLIPEGNIALGKLAQAMIHGAVVLQIQGNFDQGMQLVKQVAEFAPLTIVNSINPYRLQGQKTAAFEVVEQLGTAPDYHALPVGNAGNISAYWMGYTEYLKDGMISQRPTMLGYQADGASPFVRGEMIENPETVATAIRIGHPQSWELANLAQQESNGWFDAISDQDLLAAQRLLASKEGIFCEPASATSIAGVLRDIEAQKIAPNSKIVCTLTGHGLKDPDIAIEQCKNSLITVPAELSAVQEMILKHLLS